MQAVVPRIEAHGASIVAITPQLPEHHGGMIEKHGLAFDLLSDPGNNYVQSLGLRFDLPAEILEIYKGFGIDLARHNGDDSGTLPIPARLVVDSSGIIRAADVDMDYTRRPEPEKTLADLAALG